MHDTGRGNPPTMYFPHPSHSYAIASIFVTCKHHLYCSKPVFLDYATHTPALWALVLPGTLFLQNSLRLTPPPATTLCSNVSFPPTAALTSRFKPYLTGTSRHPCIS